MTVEANPYFREIFEGAKEDLVAALGKHRFRLWFRDAAVERVSGRSVSLAVPTEVHRTWLEFNYREVLEKAFGRVLGEGVQVEVVVSPRLETIRSIRDAMPADEAGWRVLMKHERPAQSLLGFVPPDGNSFALRLVEQVLHGNAEADPASLYLFGESGSGKTHLLKALDGALTSRLPGSVLYLTARHFTSRFVGALRSNEPSAVRAFEADLEGRRVVLLDGLDDLEPRPATQHAFEGLFDRSAGRGVRFVVAGRSHPRALHGLSERLRSRLLGGLVVRLPVPDRDARSRILASRASALGTPLPDDVCEAILERCSSVGAAADLADRWALVSRRRGTPVEARWLEEMAPPASPTTPREEVVRRAKDLVSTHYGLAKMSLERASKHPTTLLPRRVAMYLVWRSAALPLAELARAFGLKSHSAASRAIREIRTQRDSDPTLEVVVDGLLARL